MTVPSSSSTLPVAQIKTLRVPLALLFLSQHVHNLKGNALDLTSKVSYIQNTTTAPLSAVNTLIQATTTSNLDCSPAPTLVSQPCFPLIHLQFAPSSAQHTAQSFQVMLDPISPLQQISQRLPISLKMKTKILKGPTGSGPCYLSDLISISLPPIFTPLWSF